MFTSAKIRSLLNRRFEMSVRMKGGWCFVLGLAVLIPVCLYIQQPYGISHWQQSHKAFGLVGFGLIFLLIYFFTYDVLPRYCTKFYDPENWTVRCCCSGCIIFLPLPARMPRLRWKTRSRRPMKATCPGILSSISALVKIISAPIITSMATCISAQRAAP